MMRKILALSVLAFLYFFSFAQVDLSKSLPTDPDVIIGKLDNGITYYIKENHKPENRVYLRLVVNAGSVCEDDDQQGLAHFTEHMAFNGTKHFPKQQLIDFLESIGMKFGADLNAYTSFDETVYMLEIPMDKPENLDTALLILYDWANGVLMEDEEIDKERGVILEEYRLGRGAQDRMTRKIFPVVLEGSKYAQRLPIGKPEIIKNFQYDVIRRFYRDWYRPDLQAIIVVGDINPQQVEQKIKQLFSQIPKPENPRPRIYPDIPEHKDIKAVVATDSEAAQTILAFYWKRPLKIQKTYADYRDGLIEGLVVQMLNSRFNENIIKPKNPYAFGFSYVSPLMDKTEAFFAFAIVKKNRLAEAAKQLLEEIESAKRFGFSQSELERAKKQLLSRIEKQYKERDKTPSDKLISIYHGNFSVRQTPVLSFEQEYQITQQLLPTITIDDVNKKIRQLVTDKNLVITVMASPDQQLPSEQDLINIAQQVRQSTDIKPYKDIEIADQLISGKIKAGKVKKQTTDQITGTTIWTLSNGAKVVIKTTNFKNDEILLSAFSPGGYSQYPPEDLPNARFADMLVTNSGIGDFDRVALDKFLMGKNVELEPNISLYYDEFQGKSSVKDFETMLQMIYLYFTAPRFDKEAYQAAIEEEKAYLIDKAKSPEEVWYDTMFYYVCNRSIYRKPLDLTDLEKVDFQRAYEIFKERFSDPGSFTFIFVGNIDPNTAKPLIEKYIGSLPKAKNNDQLKDVKEAYPVDTVIKKIVYKGKTPKSLVYMIFTGKTASNLRSKLLVKAVSEILTKRLLKSIREEQSLTYSISASPDIEYFPDTRYGIYIFFSSNPDTVNYIEKEIIRIANELKRQITDDEYNSTIQKLLKQYEVNMKNNRYWLKQLTDIYKYNLKPEFVTNYQSIVNSFTKEDFVKAAQILNPESYLIVILKPEDKEK